MGCASGAAYPEVIVLEMKHPTVPVVLWEQWREAYLQYKLDNSEDSNGEMKVEKNILNFMRFALLHSWFFFG